MQSHPCLTSTVKSNKINKSSSCSVSCALLTAWGNWGQHWGQLVQRVPRVAPVHLEAFRCPLQPSRSARSSPDAEKTLRLFDGRGLYLEIAPSGGKWWRLKYRIGGKEKRLSLGVYTAAGSKTVEVGLEAARKAAEDARQLVRDGVDPSQERKAEKLRAAHQTGNTFEAVAREWHGKQSAAWVPAHAARILRLFERDIFPHIGSRPIAEIEAPELLTVLRRIEGRTWRSPPIVRDSTAAWYFAMALRRDAASVIPQPICAALSLRSKKPTFAAVTEPEQLPKILRSIGCL